MIYKNVLVIDDSYFDRLIAGKVVQMSKFAEQVITIGSVKEALAYLNSKMATPSEMPEVIFLDIRMPGIDGFGFLELFDKAPPQIQDNCKIFMLSSSVDPEDINRADKCKYVCSYISKPLTTAKLRELKRV